MIVRCASCNTEFALDDRQVGPDGASVRCSLCQSVFRVAGEVREDESPWQVRTLDDLLFTAPDLGTLRAWILEGRLHPDDKVSRTGRHFVRLGDMPEFSSAFEGFSGLPQLLVADDGRAPSERSALDVLGPPPAFGTEGVSGSEAPALAGVPENASDAPSSALSDVVGRASMSSSSLDARDALRAAGRTTGIPDDDERTVARAPSKPPRRPTPAPPPASARLGVPSTITDDRSSRPASMLDAVTHHVRPIKQPVVETARPPASHAAPVITAPAVLPAVFVPAPEAFGQDEEPRARRARSWPLWAALGALAGTAVVFGVPSVRARVFGAPPTVVVATAPDDATVQQDADRALRSAEPAALARAEAALQVTIDARGSDASAGMRVMRGELLATRALVHELWGAIDPAMRNDARFWAQEDAARAVAATSGLDAAGVPDPLRLARAQVLLQVAQGHGEPMAPPQDVELPLLVAVVPLLRDDRAELDAASKAGLTGLARPSVLARLTLGLGQLHAGDGEAARATADLLLAEVPEHVAARALARRADALMAGTADAGVSKPDVTPAPDDDPVLLAAPSTEESADKLIDRGCRKVEGGDAKGAVPLLRKAVEKRPNDLDALLCLGDANSKLGSHDAALRSYERALGRSPDMMTALQGAARASAKLGRTQKAVQYYRRLLEHDPGHAAARAYVDAQESSAAPDPGASDATSKG